MEPRRTTLYLRCGMIAAGKSTLAKQLAAQHQALLIGEDFWTFHLFADMLHDIDDYDRLSACLRLRNASNESFYSVKEETFHEFTRYFEMPSAEEEFNLIVHRA